MDPTIDSIIDLSPSLLIDLAVAVSDLLSPAIVDANPPWVPYPYLEEDLYSIL